MKTFISSFDFSIFKIFLRMKNLFFTLTLLLGLTLSMTSCDKDDDPISDKTVTELLTQHSWKLVGAADDCDKDNIETFNADGTYENDLGTDLCDPAEVNSTGTWELAADEMTLTVTAGSNGFTITLDFTITEITETRLVLSIFGLGQVTYEPV
jgi:hypothetical protein